jgi:hypothetical protein
MTTIAFDGANIAADGLASTYDGEIRSLTREKLRVVGGYIYGMSGDAAMFGALIAWHRSGADPGELPPSGDDARWTLIVVDAAGGIYRYSHDCPYSDALEAPCAFGSGGDIALGAMLAKATAEQAVMLVAGRTTHTGGAIRTYNIYQTLGESPPFLEAAE